MNARMEEPDSIESFCQLVSQAAKEKLRLRVQGAESKIRAAVDRDEVRISTRQYSGVIDHQASDFTVTAKAGTPVREVCELLSHAGQYLPFDPTFIDRGATVGGMVASGLNGPCRLQYGGIRDFVIGCQYVDGVGKAIRSGGRVVKNAAGFDTPKFFVGSAGRFGMLSEVTFKVFPKPRFFRTLQVSVIQLGEAVSLVKQLNGLLACEAIEILDSQEILVRLAGESEAILDAGMQLVTENVSHSVNRLSHDEAAIWKEIANHHDLMSSQFLVKVPLTLAKVEWFEERFGGHGTARRYGTAGNCVLVIISTESELAEFSQLLAKYDLFGQLIAGPSGAYLLGTTPGLLFLKRAKLGMDPQGLFGPIESFSVEGAL